MKSDKKKNHKLEEIKTMPPNEMEVFQHLQKSNEVMKAIRSQFGYSGYSNPNYINLDNQIKENDKFMEGLK